MKDAPMTGTQDEIFFSAGTIGTIHDEFREIAPDQADALEEDCRTWNFVNPDSFPGRITIWPDSVGAAIASAAGSHEGRWDAEWRERRLDDGDIRSAAGSVGEDA
jgi:hypothetical protein